MPLLPVVPDYVLQWEDGYIKLYGYIMDCVVFKNLVVEESIMTYRYIHSVLSSEKI